jgi:uncharacterized membrane protein YbhN (UPF0104 family)
VKVLAKIVLGFGFGAVLLWFALSGADLEQARSIIARGNLTYMLVAVAIYWVAMTVRVVRWRVLLSSVSALTFNQVGRVLIVGYAVNNVLPARLGEFFRADYLNRRCNVSRSAALGSIVIERLLDTMCVLVLLGTGLVALGSLRGNGALLWAAIAGCALVVAGFATVYALIFWHVRLPLGRFPWLQNRVGGFVQGLMAVRAALFVKALALSAVIWGFDLAATYLIMRGFGIEVTAAGVCLTMGAAALSTLLPSAPGYLGSLQFAFVLAYSALGLAPILGVLTATAVQLLLLGSVTLVGLAILALTSLQGMVSGQLAKRNERPY